MLFGVPTPPAERSEWPDSRIERAFDSVDKDIAGLESVIRAVAPDVPRLVEAVSTLKVDVKELEADVKVIINRSVTRQLVIVSTPLFFGAIALIVTLASLGKFG